MLKYGEGGCGDGEFRRNVPETGVDMLLAAAGYGLVERDVMENKLIVTSSTAIKTWSKRSV